MESLSEKEKKILCVQLFHKYEYMLWKKLLKTFTEGGSFFSRGKIELLFLHILKELFKTFKSVFVWTPYLDFSLRYGGPNLGGPKKPKYPKTPKTLNFIRNKKFWCQIVDNNCHFPKPFEFLKSGENWLIYATPKKLQNQLITFWRKRVFTSSTSYNE